MRSRRNDRSRSRPTYTSRAIAARAGVLKARFNITGRPFAAIAAFLAVPRSRGLVRGCLCEPAAEVPSIPDTEFAIDRRGVRLDRAPAEEEPPRNLVGRLAARAPRRPRVRVASATRRCVRFGRACDVRERGGRRTCRRSDRRVRAHARRRPRSRARALPRSACPRLRTRRRLGGRTFVPRRAGVRGSRRTRERARDRLHRKAAEHGDARGRARGVRFGKRGVLDPARVAAHRSHGGAHAVETMRFEIVREFALDLDEKVACEIDAIGHDRNQRERHPRTMAPGSCDVGEKPAGVIERELGSAHIARVEREASEIDHIVERFFVSLGTLVRRNRRREGFARAPIRPTARARRRFFLTTAPRFRRSACARAHRRRT